MPARQFDHEKLEVYQHSLRFVAWAGELLDRLPKTLAVHNQLDSASTSIPLNIAEGSAVESAACLDVLVMRKALNTEDAEAGKTLLLPIVAMMIGLIKANESGRFREDTPGYSGGEE